MDIRSHIDLQDCPACGGTAVLEEEGGFCYYIVCSDCGCHTVEIDFASDGERLDAARKTARLWNFGKVISHNP